MFFRACNESGDLGVSTPDIESQIQQGLSPLDQLLREEMQETRVAVGDQTAQLQKIAQVNLYCIHVFCNFRNILEMLNQFYKLFSFQIILNLRFNV